MKIDDFVYIKPMDVFGFITSIGKRETKNKEVNIYIIKEPNRKDFWYFYDIHLVLIYEN